MASGGVTHGSPFPRTYRRQRGLPVRSRTADCHGRVDSASGATRRCTPYDRAVLLDDQGFVQLTEGYVARREPASLLDAWRRGPTLADVRAGRAVPRNPPDDGTDAGTMTAAVLTRLRAGVDCAVLGPPGSGKSTVCKRVACEWFDAGRGPVLYRESGSGATFDDPAALARESARAEGHLLVVVEDAVQPDAQAVFDLLDRVGDAEDVTLLVDGEFSFVGNIVGRYAELQELVALVERGEVDLHTSQYELEEVNHVAEQLGNREIDGRAVIVP